MKLTDIKPNPNNPRTIKTEDFERLKGKILRNPNGLVANKIAHKDGIVIAGNQRHRALKELEKGGLKIQDDWFIDVSNWTDEQIREWLVTSNVSDGAWDWDLLSGSYEPEELEDWGIKIPNWESSNTEIDGSLSDRLNNEELRDSMSVSVILDKPSFIEFMTYVDYFKSMYGEETVTDTIVKTIKVAYEDSIR